jgi:molecular chaperone DnaK (HSP70)
MKLFQIEEPEGGLSPAEGPGASVGIDLAPGGSAVAVSLGGNAEILPDGEGAQRLDPQGVFGPGGGIDAKNLAAHLLALRARAEKQLARPVTHAVIATPSLDADAHAAIVKAADAADIELLALYTRDEAVGFAKGVVSADAAVLGAAIRAEDEAPPAG